MNDRRNFLKNLLVAGAGFMILPGATRGWKKENNVYRLVGTTTGRMSGGPNIQRCSYEWHEIQQPIYIEWAGYCTNESLMTGYLVTNAKIPLKNPSL